MMKNTTWFRWLLIGGTLLLLVVLSLPSLLLHTPLRDWVIGGVLAREGVTLEIDKVQAGWFVPVRIKGTTLGPVGKPSLLKVDEIRSDRTFMSALFQGVDVGKLSIRHPQIHIWDDTTGSNLNFPEIASRIEEAKQASDDQDESFGEREVQAEDPRSKTLAISITNAELWLKTKDMTAEEIVFQGLDFSGAVRQTSERQLLTIEPRRCLDHATVTPELCQGLLKYFLPVLAEATWAQGEFSLELDSSVIDLKQPERTTLSGRLFVHGIQAGVKNELINQARSRLASIFGRQGYDTVHLIDEAIVSFEVHDGRVWHEGLAVGLPKVSEDLVIRTSGSVSFDDQLDITIEVPMPLHLLSDGPVADALRDKSLKLSARGTFLEPKVELTEEDFVGDLLSSIGDRLAEEERPIQSVIQGIRGVFRSNADENKDDDNEGLATGTDGQSEAESGNEIGTPLLDRLRERRQNGGLFRRRFNGEND